MKRKIFILGANSKIGINIMKKFINENNIILAHYDNKNKIFSNFIRKNKIKTIQFNFLNSIKRIENFFKINKTKNFDIFINALSVCKSKNFRDTKIKEINEMFKLNLYPGIFFTKIFGINMNKKKWGRIIHLSSKKLSKNEGDKNFSFLLAKYALEFLPKSVKKWSKNNVLVNVVRIEDFKDNKDLAEFIYFLSSNDNSYITNQVLNSSKGD